MRDKCFLVLPSELLDRQMENQLIALARIFDVTVISPGQDDKESNSKDLPLNIKYSICPKNNNLFFALFLFVNILKFRPYWTVTHSYQHAQIMVPIRIILRLLLIRNFKWIHFRHHNLLHHLLHAKFAQRKDMLITRVCDYQLVPTQTCLETVLIESKKADCLGILEHFIEEPDEEILTSISTSYETTQLEGVIKFAAIGRIDWQKNYVFVLDVIEFLQNKISIQLDIYGSGNPSSVSRLKEEISNRNLSGIVNLRGFVNELHFELHDYDFMLHLARDESFGLSVAESLVLGLPVICSNVGALKEFSAFTFLQVAVDDPQITAREIFAFLHEPEAFDINLKIELTQLARRRFMRKKNQIISLYLDKFLSILSSQGKVFPK